ncbi:TonB-dependent receptor [Moraxella catarrhalis]|nr:TonB-dependent receptor [Moraxella catarrhalis]
MRQLRLIESFVSAFDQNALFGVINIISKVPLSKITQNPL